MNYRDIIYKSVPDYYSTMYKDGYSPNEILMAKRKTMLKDYMDRQEQESESVSEEVKIQSEVKVQK